MPLRSIVCPHCETAVHVQVTDVARSRTCPACAEPLLLQVAEKTSGAKRKALLVGIPPASAEVEIAPQRRLSGQPYHRMKADPEMARASRRLFLGTVTVAAMILLVSAWSLFSSWKAPAEVAAEEAPERVEVAGAPLSASRHLLSEPALSRPTAFEDLVKEHSAELAGMKGSGSE